MGFSLVFGGGGLGLMGDVARAVLDGGQDIQGIMPAFLQALEPGVSPQEKTDHHAAYAGTQDLDAADVRRLPCAAGRPGNL